MALQGDVHRALSFRASVWICMHERTVCESCGNNTCGRVTHQSPVCCLICEMRFMLVDGSLEKEQCFTEVKPTNSDIAVAHV